MALQNVTGSLPHGFTLAFLHEELLDEGPAAQTAGGLEFFQDLPALAAQFSGSPRPSLPSLSIVKMYSSICVLA